MIPAEAFRAVANGTWQPRLTPIVPKAPPAKNHTRWIEKESSSVPTVIPIWGDTHYRALDRCSRR
jgi:hypothetical protein